jgi:FixJ family two-component response regulator
MEGHTYIAVVDDDIGVCTSLGRLLRLAQLQPITYPSAEAFLGDAKHPQFDCIVLDVRLGGMSGLELFAQLTADKTHPPVIFITAVDDPVARARAEALGCAGFFLKSTPGARIIEAIRRVTRASSEPTHRSASQGPV